MTTNEIVKKLDSISLVGIEKIVSNIFWKTRDITGGLNSPYITVSKMIKEAIDKYMFIKE